MTYLSSDFCLTRGFFLPKSRDLCPALIFDQITTMFDTPQSAVMDGEGGVIYVDGGLPSKGIFRLNGGAIPLTEAELIWDPSDHLEIADISGFDIRVKDGAIWVTNAEIFGGIAQRVLRSSTRTAMASSTRKEKRSCGWKERPRWSGSTRSTSRERRRHPRHPLHPPLTPRERERTPARPRCRVRKHVY